MHQHLQIMNAHQRNYINDLTMNSKGNSILTATSSTPADVTCITW
jgi:hypothetical protein